MVFSSIIFVFYFLPLVLALYYVMPQRLRQPLLTLLSYIFYGWANPWFVFLMLFSTVVDYYCGIMLTSEGATPARRKASVAISVVVNLSLLGFFKYFGFVQQNLNEIMELFGREAMNVYTVVLPVGISFYTFQSMSYTIDLYRGDAQRARNLLDFSCYVALFPQLVAGPIVRYSDIAHQLSVRTHTVDKFARGVAFFIMGFGKKVLLANPMGEIADAAFGAGDLLWYDAWVGAAGYAFQIYFDFSGYSDMAIGLGLMLGFNFPRNFDSPYIADSITNFWARWHMSLSTWLRDYLYIPLGGNRKGSGYTYLNLAVVMLLGGMWHGAKWTFVVWGAIHGLMLIGERLIGRNSIYRALPRVLRIAFTFFILLITWVFFRAVDMPSALHYLGAMFGTGGEEAGAMLPGCTIYTRDHVIVFALAAFVVWRCRQSWDHAVSISAFKVVWLLAMMLWSIAVFYAQSFNPFLHCQF